MLGYSFLYVECNTCLDGLAIIPWLYAECSQWVTLCLGLLLVIRQFVRRSYTWQQKVQRVYIVRYMHSRRRCENCWLIGTDPRRRRRSCPRRLVFLSQV